MIQKEKDKLGERNMQYHNPTCEGNFQGGFYAQRFRSMHTNWLFEIGGKQKMSRFKTGFLRFKKPSDGSERRALNQRTER